MTPIVIDASVAIKWWLPEIHTDEALVLIQSGMSLRVPDLFLLEIENILWKKVRTGKMTREEGREFLIELDTLELVVYPSSPSQRDLAWAFALSLNQTIYDCSYVALAVKQKGVLITADQRLYNSVQGTALEPYVRWVEDAPLLVDHRGISHIN